MRALQLQLRTAVLVALARLLLARRGTTATLRHLTSRRTGGPKIDTGTALRAVQRAGRLVGATCLAQSVVLAAMLEQAEQHPTLVLGCRQYENRRWGAHAWVLVGEEVLDPVPGGPHAELARLEAASGWVPAPPARQATEG